MTVAGAERWPEPAHRRRPLPAAVTAALVLHAAMFGLTLAFIAVRTPPAPLEDQAIELVFAPPPNPAPAASTPPKAAPEPSPPLRTEPPPQVETSPPPPTEPPPAPAAEAAPPPPVPASPAKPPVAEKLEPPPLPPVADAAPPPPEPPPAPEAPPPEPLPLPPPEPPPPPPRPTLAEKSVRPPKPSTPPMAHRTAVHPEPTAAPTETARTEPAPARPAEPLVAPDWQQSISAWLAAHKTYPELALRRRQQGNVALRFTTDRSGHVLVVSLVQSAGSVLLDSAAEALVRNATLPPFPATMTQQTATITVTIRYTLMN